MKTALSFQCIEFIRSNFPEQAIVEEVIERGFEGFVMDADKFRKILQFELISKAVTAIISIDKKLSESESKIS